MSFNGSGTFLINSSGQPVSANTLITAAVQNALTADLATGLSNCITKDGQTTITANIPMSNYVFTGLGAGAAVGQSLRYEQLFSTSAVTLLGAMNWVKGADIASASTINLTTATGNGVHVTGTTTITAVTLGSGMWRLVIFDGILTLTHHATNNNLPGGTNITTAANDRALYWADGTTVYCVAYMKADGTPLVPSSTSVQKSTLTTKGDLYVATASATVTRIGVGSDGTVPMASSAATPGIAYVAPFAGILSGLTLSNNGVDATNDIDIATGGAMSSDNSYWIALGSALTKQLDAAWAVGTNQGMLATGGAIADTTYHIFLIARPDTGVVDIAADTSVTGANITANTNAAYTKFRRIGSIIRASGAILAFLQTGNNFDLKSPVNNINGTNLSTASRTAVAVTVPAGIKVKGKFSFGYTTGAALAAMFALMTDPDCTDVAAGLTTGFSVAGSDQTSTASHGNYVECMTSTSSTVGTRGSQAYAYYLNTLGWMDVRGQG